MQVQLEWESARSALVNFEHIDITAVYLGAAIRRENSHYFGDIVETFMEQEH